jgi:hypothetical protein
MYHPTCKSFPNFKKSNKLENEMKQQLKSNKNKRLLFFIGKKKERKDEHG